MDYSLEDCSKDLLVVRWCGVCIEFLPGSERFLSFAPVLWRVLWRELATHVLVLGATLPPRGVGCWCFAMRHHSNDEGGQTGAAVVLRQRCRPWSATRQRMMRPTPTLD